MAKLQLKVVSQERELLNTSVDQVSVTTVDGEITILPGHIPLVTRLSEGALVYQTDTTSSRIVVSRGFLTVAAGNQVTVMVDSAVEEREISVAKAEAAVKRASEVVKLTTDQRERLKAEAELRWALLQMKVAEGRRDKA
jgi:F-type H+-transporting ATPase subunit epsilon